MFSIAAFILMATSYQMFYTKNNRLIVRETNDVNSAICYDGTSENYYGQCVSSKGAETPQYNFKMEQIRAQKK